MSHLTSTKTRTKLEIWGKAQRESAQRPNSNWRENFRIVKLSRWQSHMARTEMHQHTQNVQCRHRVGQHAHL